MNQDRIDTLVTQAVEVLKANGLTDRIFQEVKDAQGMEDADAGHTAESYIHLKLTQLIYGQ